MAYMVATFALSKMEEPNSPVSVLLREIFLLEFQASQIEIMVVGLVGDDERRAWMVFANELREKIARKMSELADASKTACA